MGQQTHLRFCINCTDLTTGSMGSFVYHAELPFRAVSPVYTNLADLFLWLRERRYDTGALADFMVYELTPEGAR